MHTRLIAIATASLLSLSAVQVRAEVLATATSVGNFESILKFGVMAPLNGNLKTLQFTTSSPNQKVRLTYNAECAAKGPAESFLSLSILVDANAAAPNAFTSFAFCSSVSANSYVFTSVARQVIYTVPHSGVHTVSVVATGIQTTSWWLGDSSIVVDR